MSKLWGGRFSKKTNELVEKFTNSIKFDQKLAKYDVVGSLAHIEILKKARLLSPPEYKKLHSALYGIFLSIEKNKFKADDSFEDIHSYIQYLVEQKAGKSALKLHACRSRNDQVVLDMKWYCWDEIGATEFFLKKFLNVLSKLAKSNQKLQIPGYTHLQRAMPIKVKEYFLAYHEMLSRDHKRLINAYNNMTVTMGAGSLAGTIVEASVYNNAAKKFLARLNYKNVEPTSNSIDVVSDRDFVIEVLSALSILQMHLSRLAEDMILWATKEFDFIDIDDAFCTGSSLMPQKKNPDVFELVRGYTGRLYGNLVNVLVMMKGLPLSYNRDMQHDKEPLFDSFEIVQKELNVLAELLKNVKFKKENIKKQLDDECLYATDIADYLVQNKVPFKEAHTIIGKLIQYKLKNNVELRSLDNATLKTFHPLLTTKIINKLINPKISVESKKSVRRKK